MRRGHEVFIQAGAGEKSGFSDETYSKVSVKPVRDGGVLSPSAKVPHAVTKRR
jgi:alanine dehydrogenase